MTTSAYRWGLKRGSCYSALEWRCNLGPDATQADAWGACERGDWLCWQFRRLEQKTRCELLPSLLRAAHQTVNRAVEVHALHCGIAVAERWAVAWLSGEDRGETTAWTAAAAVEAVKTKTETGARMMRAARNAVRAAREVLRAEEASRKEWDTGAACWAALAMTTAAEATAWAGTKKYLELRHQAADIHAEIPEWPGEKQEEPQK